MQDLNRVKSWLPDETESADLWIETIPFSETRKYTQRVLAYSIIYDQRLGRKPRLLKQRMAPIQPADKTLTHISYPYVFGFGSVYLIRGAEMIVKENCIQSQVLRAWRKNRLAFMEVNKV